MSFLEGSKKSGYKIRDNVVVVEEQFYVFLFGKDIIGLVYTRPN